MKIHFIGIGGIGVSALAQYYLAKENEVSGSDLSSSEITDLLKKRGAKIFIGKHSPKNLPKDIDFAVYSPAVSQENPEIKKAKKLRVKVLSYPEALGELTKRYFTIAVCGTHGKSTTSAMVSLVLEKAGLNPTVIIGTKLKEFGNSNFRPGGAIKKSAVAKGVSAIKFEEIPEILIIEADEHFASFLNYQPKVIILTNIEADHLDYYKNFKNYLNSFKKFVSFLPKNGVLVANKDDKNILKIEKRIKAKKIKIKNYSIKQKEAKEIKKILKIPGEHNVYNALAALETARFFGISDKISLEALSKYKGAWRRFEIKKGKIGNKKFILVSDYAHHPTEIKATLEGAREYFPKKKIWCVFQPHQYQRTFYLYNDFVKVFSELLEAKSSIIGSSGIAARKAMIDNLIITDIYSVTGREDKEIKKQVNSKKLAKKINNKSVIYLPIGEIKNFLAENSNNFDVVIIMGAGDIYNLFVDLLDISGKKIENKIKIKNKVE